MLKLLKKYRNVVLRIFDIFIIAASYYIAEIITNEDIRFSLELNMKLIRTILLATLIYSGMLNITKTKQFLQ